MAATNDDALQRICDDVLIEIFVRVSIKDVFRFKCISKKWNHTLSTARFRHQHESMSDNWLQQLSGFFRCYLNHYVYEDYKQTAPHNLFIPILEKSVPLRSRNFIKLLPSVMASSSCVLLCRTSYRTYCLCDPIRDRWFNLPQVPQPLDHLLAGGLLYQEVKNIRMNTYTYMVVLAFCRNSYFTDRIGPIYTFSSDTRGVWKVSMLRTASKIRGLSEGFGCQVVGHTFLWSEISGGYFVVRESRARHDWAWVIQCGQDCFRSGEVFGLSKEGHLQYVKNCNDGTINLLVLRKPLHSYSYQNVVGMSEWVLKVRVDPIEKDVPRLFRACVLAFQPQDSRYLIIAYLSYIFQLDLEFGVLSYIQHFPAPVWDIEMARLLPHFQPKWPPLLFNGYKNDYY